jgi:hypothetical protein
MKDILQDLVAHTHSLGFIPLVKVSADTTKTEIEAMAEDRSVIVNAKTKTDRKITGILPHSFFTRNRLFIFMPFFCF